MANKNIEKIIKDSIKKRIKIKIKYQKNENDIKDISIRLIEPLGIDFGKNIKTNGFRLSSGELYLVAFCELREELRVFKLNRILDVETTEFHVEHYSNTIEPNTKKITIAEKSIIEVLQNEFKLDGDHVYQGFVSRKFLRENKGFFITVEAVSGTPIQNQLCIASNDEEKNKICFRSIIQIDLMSCSKISKKTRTQLVKALNSQCVSKQYPIKIIDIPDFIDTTELMASKLNRFTLDIKVISNEDALEERTLSIYKKYLQNHEILKPDRFFKNIDELVMYVEKNKFQAFLYNFSYTDYTGECELEKDVPHNTFYETVVETLLKVKDCTVILKIFDKKHPDKRIENWAVLAHDDYIDSYSIKRLKHFKNAKIF